MESAIADNGVTVVSPLPELGTLHAGDWTVFTLKWLVPNGVTKFTIKLSICSGCDDTDNGKDNDQNEDDSDDDNQGNDNSGGNNDNQGNDNTGGNNDKPDDGNHGLTNDPGNKPADETAGNQTINGNTNEGGAFVSSVVPTAAVERSSLPMTGLSLPLTFIVGLAILAPLGVIFMPIARMIRVRRK